jgi:hypothetical protein
VNSYFANITQPGSYTLTLTDAVTSCSVQHSIVVFSNTVVPSNTITSSIQTVSCNGANPATLTGVCTNPPANFNNEWHSPLMQVGALAISANSVCNVSGQLAPGIYTFVTTDIINGCKTAKTTTVTSTDAFPSYSTNSPTNFSIGCAPLNQTTINIINPISTQTPPATCSYTFLPPTFTGVVTPSIILGGNTSTITNIPGTWTVIVQDNSSFCRTELDIPIIQYTTAPHVMASMLSQTLTCNIPTVLATGSSTTPNTDISWLIPVTPPSVGASTLIIGHPPTGPVPSPNSLFYANFTVVVTNTVSACQSVSVVSIYQNFKQPVSIPAISSPGFICDGFAQLVVGGSTVTSGVPGASVYPYLWEGPPPQSTLAGSPIYNVYVQGIYSLTVQDSYNGCLKTGTINVSDNSPFFTLQGMAPSSSVSCNGTVVISPTVNAGYTVSVDMGTLTGTPQNTVTNLCYGTLHVCLTYTATGCKKCDSLMINGFTGVISNNAEDELLIYPNPSQNSFTIKNIRSAVTIKLFSSDGKLLKQQNIQNEEKINISEFSEGIYLAEIKVDSGIVRKKLVIQR